MPFPWGINQPNDAGDGEVQACVAVVENDVWDDVICQRPRFFLCQRTLNALEDSEYENNNVNEQNRSSLETDDLQKHLLVIMSLLAFSILVLLGVLRRKQTSLSTLTAIDLVIVSRAQGSGPFPIPEGPPRSRINHPSL